MMLAIRKEPQPHIIESCVCPTPYRKHLQHNPHLVILTTAERDLRVERLRARGMTAGERRRWLGMEAKPPCEPDVLVRSLLSGEGEAALLRRVGSF